MVKEDLMDESCSVVVVTFGEEVGARKWISDTGCSFPVALDSNRNIYKLLGLNRSIEKSNNTSALSFYGAALARGESPPEAFKDDDYHQMGGDFVVTRNSADDVTVTYIHRSETASDRPAIPFLLDHVASLNH